jgi:NADH-quinone oxidoreductase subunit N
VNEPTIAVINRTLLDNFLLVVPEAVLVLAACILFVGGTFRASRQLWAVFALVALAAAGLTLAFTPLSEVSSGAANKAGEAAMFAGLIFQDRLAVLVQAIALAGGAVLVLLSWNQVPDRQAADYHGCLLVAVAGLGLTGSANELITLFLALELISIPTYVLLYLPRYDEAAQEAAMKYFLLSVFSSALLLFGFSYLYGITGTTNIPAMIQALGREDPNRLPAVVLVALVMVVAGLGFRITAVPFHYYAPDVYQGAPTAAAAFLAFVPKVAGFVALVRVLGLVWAGGEGPGPALGEQVPILFWILAVVTMTLGNVMALLQNNVKRLLAYSSVAHAGYMLIGIAVAYPLTFSGDALPGVGGISALLFYLVAYAAMTVGAFGVLAFLSTPARPVATEDDLAGLGHSHPGVALLMTLFLFSLIGLPLTGGFAGKVLLFWGALGTRGDYGSLFRWLALIGVLNSAVGAYYYLRIVAKMYFQPVLKPLERGWAWPGLATLLACAAVVLALGIDPGSMLQVAIQAVGGSPAAAAAGRAD